MNSLGAFFVRWRVRLSYPLAILVLGFAKPTPVSIACAAPVGLLGILIRARAAGHLHKQEVLAVTGPYAYTRNPLYFGSAFLALAAAIAARSWISAILVFAYFAVIYTFVMRREEGELRLRHGAAFEEYAAAVPLFFPRIFPAKINSARTGAFSLAQYKKNHEYQASVGFLLLLVVFFALWWVRLRW